MQQRPVQLGPFNPPSTVEEFRIEELVGRGASGQVFRARDTLLERAVAIKFLSSRSRSARARQRFLVEARAIARLKHPNVVTVHRFGEWMGRPYLVSEYVAGQSLQRIPKPVAWEHALSLGAELARGLAAAHHEGILHRDIKPAEVVRPLARRGGGYAEGMAQRADGFARDEECRATPGRAAQACAGLRSLSGSPLSSESQL